MTKSVAEFLHPSLSLLSLFLLHLGAFLGRRLQTMTYPPENPECKPTTIP